MHQEASCHNRGEHVRTKNLDRITVSGFGYEWWAYDQTQLSAVEHRRLFDAYFSIFPFESLPADPEGFDLGCGSGRWAALMVDRVRLLHCIDPSESALEVARRRIADHTNVRFHLACSEDMPLPKESQDFGYALGVLHHVPDTEAALADCVEKLKPDAPLLVYLYYRFDNRPMWFCVVWSCSDLFRRIISHFPFGLRRMVTSLIAAVVYWPLARGTLFLERLGVGVETFPLCFYRTKSFYTMRTDALDRFGTRLEQRFTRLEIDAMMRRCGLKDIVFREEPPYWVVCGRRG